MEWYPNLHPSYIAEAVALATKVAHAPFMVAELCWSDDPEYETGYVLCLKHGYIRISLMKEQGDFNGGRLFFVLSQVNLKQCISYLE